VSLFLALIRSLFVAAFALFAVDRAVDAAFPHFERLRYNFSAAYLDREVSSLRGRHPIVVLGDSVLWGFGVEESSAAASILRARDPQIENLAYAGGGPVNTLAMLRLLLHSGVRPRAVVFNINEKQFNSEDSAYARLHPAVEQLALPLLTDREREGIVPVLSETGDARIDRFVGRFWHLYGMRPDLRDALFHDSDAAHALQDLVEDESGAQLDTLKAHRPTTDRFEGTYDLSPLSRDNVAFRALGEIVDLLQNEHVPAVAILTPTNHTLLHDYIDGPPYLANLAAVRRLCRRDGIHVLDLDARFPAADFIDNDHLTARGNALLAPIIERATTT